MSELPSPMAGSLLAACRPSKRDGRANPHLTRAATLVSRCSSSLAFDSYPVSVHGQQRVRSDNRQKDDDREESRTDRRLR
jgi:hypothetical protein